MVGGQQDQKTPKRRRAKWVVAKSRICKCSPTHSRSFEERVQNETKNVKAKKVDGGRFKAEV